MKLPEREQEIIKHLPREREAHLKSVDFGRRCFWENGVRKCSVSQVAYGDIPAARWSNCVGDDAFVKQQTRLEHKRSPGSEVGLDTVRNMCHVFYVSY